MRAYCRSVCKRYSSEVNRDKFVDKFVVIGSGFTGSPGANCCMFSYDILAYQGILCLSMNIHILSRTLNGTNFGMFHAIFEYTRVYQHIYELIHTFSTYYADRLVS